MSNLTMQQFVTRERTTPTIRDAEKRRLDFGEIYARFENEQAQEQAGRCAQCGVPYCQIHCPLSNNIPDWLALTQEGRLREAYEFSSQTNVFPEICGRICPQDRLCEGSCVIEQSGHNTVTIGAVESFITDTAWENDWVDPIVPGHASNKTVAIVGAGPAGLACAERLVRYGHKVVAFDRYDRVGGLLIYGIPNFKLDKMIVERRTAWLQDSGIEFRLGIDVGKDVSMDDLRCDFDAVMLACGVYQPRVLDILHTQPTGIVAALDYLIASNRKGLGDHVARFDDGSLCAKDKHVVVVGGGDTAMDCVRTAVRQGAKSVKCLYRRDRKNMPGSAREVANAQAEGVEFVWLSLPTAIRANKENQVSSLSVQSMRLH
ncbi:MAG: NAD(P)-dependent oxidoreductase, partial [Pseudomonadota bacterium]